MYDVYYTYFNEDAVKAVDGLNRSPNCQAYINERTD